MSSLVNLLSDAWDARKMGNYKMVKELLSQAEGICKLDDFEQLRRIWHIYMQIEADQGNYEKAIEYNKAALKYYKQSKNTAKVEHSIRHFADLQIQAGQTESAIGNYRNVLEMYHETDANSTLDYANALRAYAYALDMQGKSHAANKYWQQVKSRYQLLGLEKGVTEADKELEKYLSE